MRTGVFEPFHRIRSGRSTFPLEFDRLLTRINLLPAQDWSHIEKVFIVSTGRTGTQFLARFLERFDSVYSVHEPHPDFVELGVDYAAGRGTKEEAVRTMDRGRRAICKDVKRKGKDIYVESNNRVFSMVPLLEEVFGPLKIVHVVRDGRDYVRSGMSRDWWYSDKDWNPRMKASYFKDDIYRDRWETMSKFEKICWRWQKKDGLIYEGVKGRKDSVTVKFEDIFGEGHKGIYDICRYIGLPKGEVERNIRTMMDRKVNETKAFEMPGWKEWDEDRIRTFDEIAGEHMKRYYDYDRAVR